MKQILVTTDLSENSRRAFPLARNLAEKFDATVHLLAVIEDPAREALLFAMDFPISADQEVLQQLEQKVQSDLDTLAQQAFEGVAFKTHVVQAARPVHEEIIAQAKGLHADMLLIASNGSSGITGLLVGSVASRVAKGSSCPVTIVPTEDS